MTAIYWENAESHSNPICTDPVHNFPTGVEWKTGRKREMGKKSQKIENGPRPKVGKKWPRNGGKIENNPKSQSMSPFFGHFFLMSGRGPFLFFSQFFAIFRFRPVFHSAA